MTTIQVITGENKAEFADVLDEYFRLRHEVFVGRGAGTISGVPTDEILMPMITIMCTARGF